MKGNDIPNDIPLRAYQIAACPCEWAVYGQTGSRIADGLHKELADYIVRACNSYASDQEKIKDLLAACKDMEGCIRMTLTDAAFGSKEKRAMYLQDLQAAIEAAESSQ